VIAQWVYGEEHFHESRQFVRVRGCKVTSTQEAAAIPTTAIPTFLIG